MKTLAKICALALALTTSTALQAQTTEEPAGDALEFPIGTQPEIQVGQAYTAEVFDNWELICVKQESGPEPCEIGQLILDIQSNPISDVRIFPLPPGGQAIAGATFIVPLGTRLQVGMNFAVDDKEAKNYPYVFCNNVGCVSQVGFTPLELEALRKGTAGSISFVMVQGQGTPSFFRVPLKGFSAAYAELSKRVIALQNAQQ
jgi:invasion protein IalB